MNVLRKISRALVCLIAGVTLPGVLVGVYIAAPRFATSWPYAVCTTVAVAAVIFALVAVTRTTIELGARELHRVRRTGRPWTLTLRMAIALAHLAEGFTMRRWRSRLERATTIHWAIS